MSPVVGRAVGPSRRRSARPVKPPIPLLVRRPVAVAVAVLLAVVVAHDPGLDPGAAPPPVVEEAGAAFSLVFAAELIQEYQREHGRLPQSLSQVGLSDGQYRCVPGGDGSFELGDAGGKSPVRYDSSEGPEDLLRVMASPRDGAR